MLEMLHALLNLIAYIALAAIALGLVVVAAVGLTILYALVSLYVWDRDREKRRGW